MLKLGGKKAGGTVGGVITGVGVLLLIAVLAMGVTWSMRASAGAETAAQKTVAARFLTASGVATADVRACTQIDSGGTTGMFRCALVTAQCHRSFLFRVRKAGTTVVPYDQPRSIFASPCEFASDPAGDLS
jgi:hypothetical protein